MSYKKNIIPMALAILLHVGLVALLLWNFAFKPDEQNKQFVDSPVKARLVTAPETPKKDASSIKRRQERQKVLEEAQKKREEEKKLEEQKQQEIKQKELQQKELEQQQAEQQKLEQERIKQQEQAAEKKRIAEQKQKAEAEKKRLAEEAEKKRKAEAERKRKAAEQKKKAEAERKRKEAERKKREEAERKRKELEALEASLDDELFEADKGEVRQTQIMSERDKYRRAIAAKVNRYWYKQETMGSCVVYFTIGPGGIVLDIKDNGGDIEYCESGIAAIKKAEPLPVSDDPAVMAELKDAKITFDPNFKK